MECKNSFLYNSKVSLKNISFTFTYAQTSDSEFNEKFKNNFNKY